MVGGEEKQKKTQNHLTVVASTTAYVTGPAKTRVHGNKLHPVIYNKLFLNTETIYLWSTTCTIKSIKLLIRVAISWS